MQCIRIRALSRASMTLAAALLTMLVLAASAQAAGSVSATTYAVTFTAGASVANNVSLSHASGNFTISDSADTITAGTGCSAVDSNTVTCSSSTITSLQINLGSDADTFSSTLADSSQWITYVYGGDGADDITGGSGIDEIRGEAGNDEISGGAGVDKIVGGAGADDMAGGTGRDLASYEDKGSDTYVYATIDGVAIDGVMTLSGSEGDNVHTDFERLEGGYGGDQLEGSSAANEEIHGGPGSGNDTLDGGGGSDIIDGSGGSADMVTYQNRSNAVTVDLDGVDDDGESGENDDLNGIEYIRGGGGNDTLTGDANSNVIQGMGGNDTVNGGDGDDTLYDQTGADTYSGGGGTYDNVSYAERTVGVFASIDGFANDGPTGEGDSIGNDVEVLEGGSGDDNLSGSSDNETFWGNAGHDRIDGGLGADFIDGGGDNQDYVDYTSRTNAVNVSLDGTANDGESGENDHVSTSMDGVLGGSGNDTITGDDNDNFLLSYGGNDTLYGQGGNDQMYGGTGSDVFWGGNGADDLVYYNDNTNVNRTIDNDGAADDGAAGENDNIQTDVENLGGGMGNDTITGNSGDNDLYGQAGNDTITGGAGADSVDGSDGNDTIYLNDGANTDGVTCGANNDTVTANTSDWVNSDCESVTRV